MPSPADTFKLQLGLAIPGACPVARQRVEQAGVAGEPLQDCPLSEPKAGRVEAADAQRPEALGRRLDRGPEIVAGERDVIPLDWRDVGQELVRNLPAPLTYESDGVGEVS